MQLFILCIYFFYFTLHVSGSHKPIIRGLQYCNIVIRLPTDATVYFVYLFPLFLPYMFRALISPSSGVSRTVFFIYKHLVSVLDYIHLHTPPYTFNREAQTTGYTVEHTHTKRNARYHITNINIQNNFDHMKATNTPQNKKKTFRGILY